jgi:hypothetical protein
MSEERPGLSVAQQRILEYAAAHPQPDLEPSVDEKLAEVLDRLEGLERGHAALASNVEAISGGLVLEGNPDGEQPAG